MNVELSVIMPVFNGEKHLKEAIESVLNQTFEDFELIVINDGSTDLSLKIIKEFQDNRIRLINNESNNGIAFTRNIGLAEASGEFLAWMDCDDLIDKDRFNIQLEFLKANPQIGICGTWLERFNEGKPTISTTFLEPEMIKAGMIFKPSVLNATSMFRMEMIKKAKLVFDTNLAISEDFNFYVDACFHFPITNIPQKLYYYRASETSIMKHYDGLSEKKYHFHKVVYKKWFERLQLPQNEENFRKHEKLSSTDLFDSKNELRDILNWLQLIKSQNDFLKVVDQSALDKVLGNMFYFLCKKSSQMGLYTFIFYLFNRKVFDNSYSGSLLKLFIRCLIRYKKF